MYSGTSAFWRALELAENDISHDEATAHKSDPDEALQQETSVADAHSTAHGRDSAAVDESKLELPLLERQEGDAAPIREGTAGASTSPAPAIRLPITSPMPPHTVSLSMCDTSNREGGQENIMSQVGASKQRTAVMHAQITLQAAAGEGTPLPVPCQHPHAERSARTQPLCSDTGVSQHADVDSRLGAAERGPQTRVQQARSYNHSSSVDSEVAALASHGQSSDEPHKDELYVTAAVTSQSSSASVTSRSRPAGSVALDPLHPAKAIWLGFVRRAYRKFGKEMLSTVDLRWRTRGASVLAAAWKRTDAARKLATAKHASAHAADAAAAMGDVELDQASTASVSAGCTPSPSLSSPCVLGTATAATMHDIDVHQEVQTSMRRTSRSRIRASADVQLRLALTNMLQVGGGGSNARNWVLTWPSGMVEFDVDQLLLMQNHAALHRSRNARPKSMVHGMPLQSASESS